MDKKQRFAFSPVVCFLLNILQIILPVFILLGVGYAAVKVGYLQSDLSDALNKFTVKLTVPVLLFRAMVNLDFSLAYEWRTLTSFYTGAVISFFLAIFLARKIWQRRPGEAVAIGFCALFSNTVLLGIPIIDRAYGDVVSAPMFGIISLHAACMYALGMITMELARRDGQPLGSAFTAAAKSILGNSLMIGVLLGVAVNLMALPLPELVAAPMNLLANAAIPVALIGIGAALPRYEINADFGETAMVTVLALVVHPVIAFLLAYGVFGLEEHYVKAAVMLAAMPPGMNIYIFAVMYDRAIRLSASAFVIATAVSILTISCWLLILGRVFG